jgi:hypothetical protein
VVGFNRVAKSPQQVDQRNDLIALQLKFFAKRQLFAGWCGASAVLGREEDLECSRNTCSSSSSYKRRQECCQSLIVLAGETAHQHSLNLAT